MRYLGLMMAFLGCPAAWAQPVYLVKDVAPAQTSPNGPGPQELLVMGGTLFFSGQDPANGRELWRSDGTTAGTRLVRDIFPGGGSSVPVQLTDVGGTLYFVAFDGESGRGLWKSDGTAAGTVLVKGAGPDFLAPDQLVVAGGTLFLAASDPGHGRELWKSDGTAAGTVRVSDIRPGSGDSIPSFPATEFGGEQAAGQPYFADLGGTLFFVADDGTTGRELWRSDGTPAGTTRVQDIRPGPGGSSPSELTTMGGTLFFYARDLIAGRELWKSDGTPLGTTLVADVCPGPCGSESLSNFLAPGHIAEVNGTLFFVAFDGAGGEPSLWRTDGTTPGTTPVADPFTFIEVDTHLTSAGGLLYFIGGGSSAALWRSDGTAPGTFLLANVDDQNQLVGAGTGLLLLSLGSSGMSLWTSDGTVAGTSLVQSFAYSGPGLYAAPFGGALLFAADDGTNGRALWGSDGTPGGTALVKDLHPGLCDGYLPLDPLGGHPCGSSSPVNSTDAAGMLFFSTSTLELWRSDGTDPGTGLVSDLCAGCDLFFNPELLDFTAVSSRLFMRLRSAPSGPFWTSGLLTSDGTSAGTISLLATDFASNLTGSIASLYLQADASPSNGLWTSDGTPAGTLLVQPFPSISPFNPNPDQLTDVGGTLFMTGEDSASGSELWKSDGTTAGTVLLADIVPGAAGSHPAELTAAAPNVLFFTADDGLAGRELWTSDGTAAGTVRVKDIFPGPGSSFPHGLVAIGPTVYFVARDAAGGYELWASGGTDASTYRVADIRPGSDSSSPSDLTALGGLVIFTANDGVAGREPWRSDGTPGGTFLLRDIVPGAASSAASGFVASGTRVLFGAADPARGRELWTTDGSAAGTELVQDIAAGPGSSDVGGIAASGSRVFLAADDGIAGRELWALDTSATEVDLAIGMVAAPEPVLTGGALDYTLSIANASPTPATGVSVTDTLPAGVSFVSSVPGSPTCQQAAGVVTCSLGTLAPVSGTTVTITVTVNLPSGQLVNTASVAGVETDPLLGNNSATVTSTVSPADLSVALQDAPDPAPVGGAIDYTMAATNNGPAPATGVTATLVLSPGLSFVSSVPGPPTCVDALNVVTCDFGSLAPAATSSAVITATAGAASLVTADATVTGAEIDTQTANNAASATTTITGLTLNELVHGSIQSGDLAAAPGPTADQDWYRIGQSPRSSYEVVVDAVSGDLGPAGPELRRMAPDGATTLQESALVGGRSSRALGWENPSGARQDGELLEVRSLGCTTGCTSADAYRIRAYETTGRISRFNNAGSQITVLVLQNVTDRTVSGTAWFWDAQGALLTDRTFVLAPRGTYVVDTSAVQGLVGLSGSITVTSDAGYGGLAGKAVALEPATGFTFDSPLVARER